MTESVKVTLVGKTIPSGCLPVWDRKFKRTGRVLWYSINSSANTIIASSSSMLQVPMFEIAASGDIISNESDIKKQIIDNMISLVQAAKQDPNSGSDYVIKLFVRTDTTHVPGWNNSFMSFINVGMALTKSDPMWDAMDLLESKAANIQCINVPQIVDQDFFDVVEVLDV